MKKLDWHKIPWEQKKFVVKYLAGRELVVRAVVIEHHNQRVFAVGHLLTERCELGGFSAGDPAALPNTEDTLQRLVQVLLVSVPEAGHVGPHLSCHTQG